METFVAILCGGAGAAVFTGIFRLLELWLQRKAKKEDNEENRQIANCEARGSELAAVKKDVKALVGATMFLTYDRIRHLCEVYIGRGQITTTELKILTDMHRCYHDDLNGNGFLDALMEQVHQLPIVAERQGGNGA